MLRDEVLRGVPSICTRFGPDKLFDGVGPGMVVIDDGHQLAFRFMALADRMMPSTVRVMSAMLPLPQNRAGYDHRTLQRKGTGGTRSVKGGAQ